MPSGFSVTAPCAPCVTPVTLSVPLPPLPSFASTLTVTALSSAVCAVSAPATGSTPPASDTVPLSNCANAKLNSVSTAPDARCLTVTWLVPIPVIW